MSCNYCTLEELTAGNQSWREGPLREFRDGERLNAQIESDGDGYKPAAGYVLYVEHPVDYWADEPEWEAANVPITHCPWCGGEL